MEAIVVISAIALGLLVGSFANVPIYRWPRGGSISQPRRSSCPDCGMRIRVDDNVPVVSWLRLHGRCRYCGAPITPRYMIVEAVTALLFALIAWQWGLDPLLPALLVFAWTAVVATAIDLEHRIIPNRMTLRAPFILGALLLIAAAVDGAWADLLRAAIAAVALPAGMFGLSEAFRLVRGQDGMGMGDVKYAISIGMVVGYLSGLHLVVFAYGTIISAVVVAISLVAAGRAKLASRIPFGPYLAGGALLAIIAGAPLTGWLRELLLL